ncbi:MAG: hypothetical protein ABEI77_08455 [Halorientalis sp.]
MTLTATQGSGERLYRRLYVGLWLVSGVFLAGAITAGYPVVGAVGFWVIALASIVVYRSYDGALFDERDRSEYQSAAGLTLAVFGWGSAVVFPTMTVLDAINVASWPWWLASISWFIPLLYGTFGVILLVEKYR